jgi:hypothetical protein
LLLAGTTQLPDGTFTHEISLTFHGALRGVLHAGRHT